MIEFSTNEEIVMYIQSLPKGSKEAKKAIAILWAKNIVLVRKVIEQSTKIKYKENEFDDLLQQAYFGFYEAIYRYSTTTEYKFSSYICNRVKWEVNNYSQSRNSGVRIPYYVRIKIRACINKKRELEREYGHFVSDETALKALDLSQNVIKETLRVMTSIENIQSLDACVSSDEDCTAYDFLADSVNIEEKVLAKEVQNELHDLLLKALQEIPQQTRDAIIRHYFNDIPYTIIAKEMGTTDYNLYNHEKTAFETIRKGKYGKRLSEFLQYTSRKEKNIRLSQHIKTAVTRLPVTDTERKLLVL